MLKPWRKKQWCIPEVSAEFVASMEDVLEVYAEPYDPTRPKVNFDETNKPLLKDTRPPLPARFRPCRQRFPVRGLIPTIRHASALPTPFAISAAYRSRLAVCGATPGTPLPAIATLPRTHECCDDHQNPPR